MPQLFLKGYRSQLNDQNPEFIKRFRINSVLFSAPSTIPNGYYYVASQRLPGNPGHNVIDNSGQIPNYNILLAVPVQSTSGNIFYEPMNPQWIDVNSTIFLYNFFLIDPDTLAPIDTALELFSIVLDYETA